MIQIGILTNYANDENDVNTPEIEETYRCPTSNFPRHATNSSDSSTKDFTRWLMDLVTCQREAFSECLQNLYHERDTNRNLSEKLSSLQIEYLKIKTKLEAPEKLTKITRGSTRPVQSPEELKLITDMSEHTIQLKIPDHVPKQQQEQDQIKTIRTEMHREFIQHKRYLLSEPKSKEITTQSSTKDIPSIQDSANPIITTSVNNHSNEDDKTLSLCSMCPETTNSNYERSSHQWNEDVVLVAGDSLIGGIVEQKLSARKLVKVRSFPGSLVEDMKYYLTPLIKKRPTKILVETGTNNAIDDDAKTIFDKIVDLQTFIKGHLPDTEVTFMEIPRRADNPHANKILREVNTMLKTSNIRTISNDNIEIKHLGKKGLHLNYSGTKIMASNIIKFVRPS